MKVIQIFDTETPETYAYSRVYSGRGGRFTTAGAVGVEFVMDGNGRPVYRDGIPVIATDSAGNQKRGPIIMQWVPDGVLRTRSDGTVTTAGAWFGATSSSETTGNAACARSFGQSSFLGTDGE